jgi:hypothetical protein
MSPIPRILAVGMVAVGGAAFAGSVGASLVDGVVAGTAAWTAGWTGGGSAAPVVMRSAVVWRS